MPSTRREKVQLPRNRFCLKAFGIVQCGKVYDYMAYSMDLFQIGPSWVMIRGVLHLLCQGAPVMPYDKLVILATYPHSMFQWIFLMQNAVRSSKECIPNAPSAMDSSTFVQSLSGLNVSSIGVPTFSHETCILKGDKYCNIYKLIKTLIGHSMCRWRLQNKIYCKVAYLTLEFVCRVQGTYHAMIRTSPRSS
jgi:hypothetical protein